MNSKTGFTFFLICIVGFLTSFSAQAAYVDVGSKVKLHYTEAGHGDPMIFVAGWTFPSAVFQKQLEHFKKTHRVILLDPRSVGGSTQTKKGHTYKQYGRDLHRVIKKLKLKRVVLVGWSYGCLQTFDYVRRHGTKRLSAFICIDQCPKPLGTADNWSEGPKSAFDEFIASVRTKRRAYIGDYIDNYFLTDPNFISKKHRTWLLDQSDITSTDIAVKLMQEGIKSDYTKTVINLPKQVPTLWITNQFIGAKAKKWWVGQEKPAQIKSFGGHYMYYQFADKFNATVEQFLRESRRNR